MSDWSTVEGEILVPEKCKISIGALFGQYFECRSPIVKMEVMNGFRKYSFTCDISCEVRELVKRLEDIDLHLRCIDRRSRIHLSLVSTFYGGVG